MMVVITHKAVTNAHSYLVKVWSATFLIEYSISIKAEMKVKFITPNIVRLIDRIIE